MDKKKEIKTDVIPDAILKYSEDNIGFIPSIIETDFYTVDVLRTMLSKNKLICSNKYYDGSQVVYNSGLIEFKESEILFYFIKRKDENSYKFYCLSKEKSSDSIIFYLNQLKKFKTIT